MTGGGASPGSAGPSRSGGRLVLVTGMSGAGRSTALKALEDLGYEAVDNLPLSLLPSLSDAGGPVAVGIDVRTRGFAPNEVLATLPTNVSVVFLDADDELLRRRYTETRRPHPLAFDRPVIDGIRLERQLVSALRDRASLVIDTSTLSVAELRRILAGHFALDAPAGIAVFVRSFAYRRGLPPDADLVFDVRFLENPHYDPALRPLTGLDPAVGARIAADPGFEDFFERLTGLLRPLLPRYANEGKTYLTIAVGCTGGRHRSVYVAERLAEWLRREGQRVSVGHRDLELSAESGSSASTLKDKA
ncbi:MAG: RNase adapter RapZ [Rhodospirillales bacterium]|nr:RNase adapter RapZ [Rhodospirillales bacterium]